MATNIIPSGPNPQQPIQISELFVPDQLIAGDLKIVSDSVLVNWTTPLNRGAVLGRSQFGSLSASTGKTPATGTITINASSGVIPAVVAGDTLTIGNGTTTTVITFNALPTGELLQQAALAAGVSVDEYSEQAPPGTQWIAATIAAQTAALVEYLNSSVDPVLSLNTYAISGAGFNVITATSNIYGTGGNAYTLATSDATAFTVSAGTFAGGTANTGTATVGTMSGGPQLQAGQYLVTLTATGATAAFSVMDPHGEFLAAGLIGTAYKSPQVNFTITTGGSPTTGDIFVITGNPTNVGVYKLAQATAGDGSGTPVAILADYCDPTLGGTVPGGQAVNAPVYLMAEVNGAALLLDPSITLANAKAQLRLNDIFVKTSVSANDPS